MGNTKRALLLGASGLGVLSLVVGAFFVHSGAAAASPAANNSNSGTITYTANPPTKLSTITATSPSAFPTPAQCVAAFGLACYTPAEIRQAYNVPASATGAGQTIVIVDAYGSPTVQSDLHTFDVAMGLPDPTLNIIYPGGSPTFNPLQNHDEAGWASETSLDVQWSHALAPAATIDLVVAANNAGNVLNNAVSYAVQNHLGNVLSMSYGSAEAAISGGGNNSQLQQAHANFVAAQAAHMSLFASAGDNGATDGTSVVSADYPASDPLVTAVGGTNLFTNSKGAYSSETVWNDGDNCPFGCTDGVFGATGGAPSVIFPAPSYQSALSGNSARTTADVGYNASVYTSVLVYLGFYGGSNNGFYFFGGTSEGAPQWAAITADADQAAGHALGFLNPTLYAIGANKSEYAADFHDITVGDNGFEGPGFPAGKGYDMPTGLGSPNVANLIHTLAG